MANPGGHTAARGPRPPGQGRGARSRERCGPSPGHVKCHTPGCCRAGASLRLRLCNVAARGDASCSGGGRGGRGRRAPRAASFCA